MNAAFFLRKLDTRHALIAWGLLWIAVALAANWQSIITADNAWLLYAARRMLSGERLYVDILETNPPLIIWLYAIPAWIAEMSGQSPVHGFILFVASALLGCAALTYGALKRHPLFVKSTHVHIVMMGWVMAMFGCSTLFYGQREHFWLMMISPYLMQTLYGFREPSLSVRQVAIGVLAALGFALKPFFALVWIANELCISAMDRSLRRLFRPSMRVMVLTGLCYLLAVWMFTPEYYRFILPALLRTYSGYKTDLLPLLGMMGMISLIVCLPLFFYNSALPWRRVNAQLLARYAAACLVVLVQQKGWYNHYYPLMAFGVVHLSIALVKLSASGLLAMPIRRGVFAVLCALAVAIVVVPLKEMHRTSKVAPLYRQRLAQLMTYVHRYAEGKNVAVLSFNLGSAFPSITYLPVRYPMHFHHLWMVPGVIRQEQAGMPDAVAQQKQFALQTVASDFRKHLPELVWVDSNSTAPEPFKNFDFIDFFKQDRGFAASWTAYKKIGQLVDPEGASPNEGSGGRATPTYDVYIRTHSKQP